jgi:hypothetical protein
MQRHPEIGERILRSISRYERLATIVRHEHERYDGHGYPDGLAADQIPLVSRIILVADAYHAMTSDCPYRAALDRRVAAARLVTNAGSQFHPNAVHALLAELRIEPDTSASEDAVLTGLRPHGGNPRRFTPFSVVLASHLMCGHQEPSGSLLCSRRWCAALDDLLPRSREDRANHSPHASHDREGSAVSALAAEPR